MRTKKKTVEQEKNRNSQKSVNSLNYVLYSWQTRKLKTNKVKVSKVVPYSIMSVGHGADPSFLAVSLQVPLVINAVVGCCYFSPDPRLLSQAKRSSPWPIPNYTAWWQRHTRASGLPKATLCNATQPGLEPATYGLQVHCPANSDTRSPKNNSD